MREVEGASGYGGFLDGGFGVLRGGAGVFLFGGEEGVFFGFFGEGGEAFGFGFFSAMGVSRGGDGGGEWTF